MKHKNKQLTYGLVLDLIASWDDVDYYQSLIISGVADFAKGNGINLMCFVTGKLHSPYEWEQSRNILFEFIDKNKVDGLIVSSSAVEAYCTPKDVVKRLESYKDVPIITIGDSYEGYYSVSSNSYSGMRQVVDHLIEIHDCRRIVFIKGIEGSKGAEYRFDAYLDSLEDHNIPVDQELIFQGNFDFMSGNNTIKSLLENKIQFDAVVAANDNMAIGAMDEFYNQYGRIPQDIPITGFDDVEASGLRAMTTVHQPCYELARTASNMLLQLIHGEDVLMEEQMPTEMVVRSSCGCIPSVVKNSLLEIQQTAKQSSSTWFREKKSCIGSELKLLNLSMGITLGNCEPEELLGHEQKLMDAFFDEYKSGKSNQFLYAWNNMILWCVLQKIDLSSLHDILSCIRKVILENFTGKADLIMAGSIFQAARTQISDAIRSVGSQTDFFSSNQTDKLIGLEEELISNMDWHTQIELVYENIAENGINKCYIALYDDPKKPLEYSRLILAFDGHQRFDTGPDGILFKTCDLLPEAILKDLYQDSFNVIIQALHQGEDQLGFVVFGFESRINRAYDIMRYRLSVALKGSLLIERIRNQAVDLEKQVIERTEELSVTNRQLTEEIAKRKEAEDKLRSILAELEDYNHQLHNESIRDELTGLYNRRGFMTVGYEKYDYSRTMKQGFLVFFADLDGLKQINDVYGHKEGDYTIVKVAEILTNAFRCSDIVSRLGGDEFTVIAIETSSADEDAIRNRVEHLCELYNQTSNKPYKLSISIGSAYFNPQSPSEFEELLKMADKALYDEKQRKKRVD